jgi:aromatase
VTTMAEQGAREVEHSIEIDAPADRVYGYIADAAHWPRMFPPSVHVERLEGDDRHEVIQIWATANGAAKTWRSRRDLDPAARRVRFRQVVSQPPVAAMGGTWIVEPLGGDRCRVRLRHDYRAVDDNPDGLAWIEQALDRNSTAELAALKANAERDAGGSPLLLSFDDAVRVAGRAKDVYDFLDRADLWQQRLPHVARVVLTEDPPGLQVLEMDTRTAQGTQHTTRSVRVCRPHRRIVYKQTVLPALLSLHTGEWSIEPDGDGLVVTSRHTVAIREEAVTEVLGAGADVARARAFLREALGGNSRATLNLAKEHAEQLRSAGAR